MNVATLVGGFMRNGLFGRFAVTLVLLGSGCMASTPAGAVPLDGSWYDQALTQATAAQFTSMSSVSCPQATFCAAGGSYTVAHGRVAFVDTFNGTRWSAHTINASLGTAEATVTAVSCVSSTFCIAVGNFVSRSGSSFGYITTWNGVKWRQEQVPSLPVAAITDSLDAVSCVAGPFCVVGGSYLAQGTLTTTPFVSRFDGVNWVGQTFEVNSMPASPTVQLAAGAITTVSCVSSTFCVAGGGYGDATSYGGGFTTEPMVAVWNGVRWSAEQIAESVNTGHSGSVTALSCTDDNFCFASGVDAVQQPGNKSVFTSEFNGATWLSVQFTAAEVGMPDQNFVDVSMPSVSCSSRSFCVIVGSFRYHYQNLTRSQAFALVHGVYLPLEASLPPTGSAVALTVSCASSIYCVAGGFDAPVTSSLTSVIPPTFAFVSVWNGGAWKDQPVATSFPSATNAAVQAVSCAVGNACQAVGNYLDAGNNQQDFASTNVLLAQTPLSITTPTKVSVGRRVFLATAGGSGTVAPTFTVAGNHCVLDGALLTATAATTCDVSARNQANGMYLATVSPVVTFHFSWQPQRPLVLRVPLEGLAGRPIATTVTGGSGRGAVRLVVSGRGCVARGLSIVLSNTSVCTVRAVKAASGVYASAASDPVVLSLN